MARTYRSAIKGIFRYVFIPAATLVLLAYIACYAFRLPWPQNLLPLALETAPPSKSYRYFDTVAWPASDRPLHFQEAAGSFTDTDPVPWRGGRPVSFADFQYETHTNALLILHRNKLVYEKYYNGNARETSFPSFSLAKAIVSALVGAALQDGFIKSIDDPVANYVPALAGASSYANITIRQLLDMRAGIDVEERYDSPFSRIAYMYASTDLNRFVSGLRSIAVVPGTAYDYKSVDYQLLTMMLKGATGKPASAYLNEKLWQPMGAQYDASWSVDSAQNKVEKGFCCINARAIDFVKIGALYLNQGVLNGKRILPAAWTRRHQNGTGVDDFFLYGNGWWLPMVPSPDKDFAAIGIYGQFIYVNPATGTVIVKMSDHGAEQDEALTFDIFRTVAQRLAGSRP